jgi:hypothetical protein
MSYIEPHYKDYEVTWRLVEVTWVVEFKLQVYYQQDNGRCYSWSECRISTKGWQEMHVLSIGLQIVEKIPRFWRRKHLSLAIKNVYCFWKQCETLKSKNNIILKSIWIFQSFSDSTNFKQDHFWGRCVKKLVIPALALIIKCFLFLEAVWNFWE